MRQDSKKISYDSWLFYTVALLPPVALYVIFASFFPLDGGLMGHDYRYFGPKHVAGVYWFRENGLFEIPWFTPALCGGVPLYPNPQSSYYSIHQFMMFVFEPVMAYQLSFMLIGILGYSGMYFLLSKIFGVSRWLALLGATVFMFNTFFTMRSLIGHLTLHVFMLAPWLIYHLILAGKRWQESEKISSLFASLSAALILAYMFYAGGVHFIPAILLSAFMVLIFYCWKEPSALIHWAVPLSITFSIMLLLDGSKLIAALAFFGEFKRDFYPLPGTPSILLELELIFKSLFLGSPVEMLPDAYTNSRWKLDRHEFEFSITPVPFVLILCSLIFLISQKRVEINRSQALLLILLFVLCSTPLLLNLYTPQWNVILKSIPIIKSSSNLYRWFLSYMIPLIVLGILLLHAIGFRIFFNRLISMIGITAVLVYIAGYDKRFYSKQSYDITPLQTAYAISDPLPVSGVGGAMHPVTHQPVLSSGFDHIFGQGLTSYGCYMSIFGYRLESFPLKSLHPGSIYTLQNGVFNMKNPACYLFPIENHCTPGDHFTKTQHQNLVRFAAYKPYPFGMSQMQMIANHLTILAFVGCLVFYIFFYTRNSIIQSPVNDPCR